MDRTGLYVHYPFCHSKCPYCDFYSIVAEESLEKRYLNSLLAEIVLAAPRWQSHVFDTIFFGGGTPSLIDSENLNTIIEALRSGFRFESDTEITLEANPESLNVDALKSLRTYGVNRISIGVQSFVDEELKTLGRIHDAECARRAIDAVKKAGFDSFSIDLIYGMNGQTRSSWRRTLNKAIASEPTHISAYCLTLEGGTPMQRQVESGAISLPDDTLTKIFYEMLLETTEKAGYNYYEISNFAKRGYESRHNLKYWKRVPYLGLGPSAHSYDKMSRWCNISDLASYCQTIEQKTLPVAMSERIDSHARKMETIMLGLRLKSGVSFAEVEDIIDEKQLDEMAKSNLIELRDGNLRITRNGLFICDEIIVRLIGSQSEIR